MSKTLKDNKRVQPSFPRKKGNDWKQLKNKVNERDAQARMKDME